MTQEQRECIKNCITFYDGRGWDWSLAVAFLICRFELGLDTLALQIMKRQAQAR